MSEVQNSAGDAGTPGDGVEVTKIEETNVGAALESAAVPTSSDAPTAVEQAAWVGLPEFQIASGYRLECLAFKFFQRGDHPLIDWIGQQHDFVRVLPHPAIWVLRSGAIQ